MRGIKGEMPFHFEIAPTAFIVIMFGPTSPDVSVQGAAAGAPVLDLPGVSDRDGGELFRGVLVGRLRRGMARPSDHRDPAGHARGQDAARAASSAVRVKVFTRRCACSGCIAGPAR